MRNSIHVALFILTLPIIAVQQPQKAKKTETFPVGVVLDMDTLVGKMSMTSISMAIDDFYSRHSHYRTRLVVFPRDSMLKHVQAASQVLDLIENEQVQAIIGPQKSEQALFISEIGNTTRVPIISFSATSPSLSSTASPYFIRTTLNDSAQVNAIASFIKVFGWRRAVPVYEDTQYGRDIVPYLVDALLAVDAIMPYRSAISLSSSDDQIKEELYKLMTMPTRVFIVHMSVALAIRVLTKAKEVGMMTEGYVWIATDGVTNVIDSLDYSGVDAMQGVVGVKPFVPDSVELNNFKRKWKRRFMADNPGDHQEVIEPNNYAFWAYDTVWALAMAAEKVRSMGTHSFKKQRNLQNPLKLIGNEVSATGPPLLNAVSEIKFTGLSGGFQLVNGQLQPSVFQIVNIVSGKGTRNLGFWTAENGFSKELMENTKSVNRTYSTSISDLNPVIWPGGSTAVSKGWEIPVSGKKLRIGVPVRDGFRNFVNVGRDPTTNRTIVTGYCIDIFEAVVESLPYALAYEYIPFENALGEADGTYNDLVYQVYLQNYDAVVGDVTIRANRSNYVDFTLAYTESGVSMLVPVEDSAKNNRWSFTQPLTWRLWLVTFFFFIAVGFAVWRFEHNLEETEFKGTNFLDKVGVAFYFAFSTLVFSHGEKLQSNFSRFVIVLWLFVVLILQTNYTASMTSILTVKQLQPTITDLEDLRKNGDYVGYNNGSFVVNLLKEHQFDALKLKAIHPDDYVQALTNGTKNGGVSAIVHEIPYLKLFLAKHCEGYAMLGPIFKTAGFGFVFPKGSPLVPDISKAILNVTEGETMKAIERKWFGDQLNACLKQGKSISTDISKLDLQSFKELFIITGVVVVFSLALHFIYSDHVERLRRERVANDTEERQRRERVDNVAEDERGNDQLDND